MTQTEIRHLLSGDLLQMSIMDQALRAIGIDVVRQNVYPAIAEKDFDRALRYLFEARVEGWWNQESEYIRRGIMTRRQFDLALGRVPRDGRLVIQSGNPGTEGYKARVLTYEQMWLLVYQRKADLAAVSDETAVYRLNRAATWQNVNYVCLTKPRHTEGEWYVDHEGDEMAIWSALPGKSETRVHLATTAAHDIDYPDDVMAQRTATSYLMVQAQRMLHALAVVSLDSKLRELLLDHDPMAIKQIEDALDAVLDGQGGPL